MHFEPIPAYRFLTDPKIPLGSRRFRAAYGGRGSAKSWEFTNAALFHTVANAGLRVVFLREVQANLKESSIELVRTRLDHYGLLSKGYFREVDNSFEGVHGQKIMFMGLWKGGKAEGIKSLEGASLTVLEEATEVTQRSIDVLIPTVMRTPKSEIWAIWNPRLDTDPIDQFFRGPVRPPKSICVKINYDQNPHFPEAMREVMELDFAKDPQRAAWIWNGEYMPSIGNALWSRDMINKAWRIGQDIPMHDLGRVIVSVDPSGSADGGDEVGIVVLAECGDGVLVLDDRSCSGASPLEWATEVARAVKDYNAQTVVAEGNYGGEMVKSNLRSAEVNVHIELVTAKEKKHLRAGPVATLYERGLVWHKDAFPKLEAQMTMMSYTGWHGVKSPDRLDALVHGVRQLKIQPQYTVLVA
jgi:hypothetical protein